MTACRHFELARDEVRAVVCTTGAALVRMTVDGVLVVTGDPVRCSPDQYRGSVLAPWPGRLADGTYVHASERYAVPINEPSTGCALHGLVAHREWTVADARADQVTLAYRLGDDPGYPFPLGLSATYTLHARGVRADLSATNHGTQPAPVGLGAHPYLSAGADVDRTLLGVPAATVVALDGRGLPTAGEPADDSPSGFRTPRRIGAARLDHAFADLDRDEDGWARVRLAAAGRTVIVAVGTTARWLTIYTSDTLEPPARRSSIAVEPMTCPADALRSRTGLHVLAEHETLTLTYDIRADDER